MVGHGFTLIDGFSMFILLRANVQMIDDEHLITI